MIMAKTANGLSPDYPSDIDRVNGTALRIGTSRRNGSTVRDRQRPLDSVAETDSNPTSHSSLYDFERLNGSFRRLRGRSRTFVTS